MQNSQVYYGTKKVKAAPTTLLQYNVYRGWVLPAEVDGSDKGYMVEYDNGGSPNNARHQNYIYWSPAAVFESAYQPEGALSFGHAIVAAKAGKWVSRIGWNGKGMFIYYVKANSYPVERNAGSAISGHFSDNMVPYRDYLAMLTAQGDVVPWVASQSDILSDDWFVIE